MLVSTLSPALRAPARWAQASSQLQLREGSQRCATAGENTQRAQHLTCSRASSGQQVIWIAAAFHPLSRFQPVWKFSLIRWSQVDFHMPLKALMHLLLANANLQLPSFLWRGHLCRSAYRITGKKVEILKWKPFLYIIKESEDDLKSPHSEDRGTTAQRRTSSVLWCYWLYFHSTAKRSMDG